MKTRPKKMITTPLMRPRTSRLPCSSDPSNVAVAPNATNTTVNPSTKMSAASQAGIVRSRSSSVAAKPDMYER
jgi:hypothetical protein